VWTVSALLWGQSLSYRIHPLTRPCSRQPSGADARVSFSPAYPDTTQDAVYTYLSILPTAGSSTDPDRSVALEDQRHRYPLAYRKVDTQRGVWDTHSTSYKQSLILCSMLFHASRQASRQTSLVKDGVKIQQAKCQTIAHARICTS
jgi:hypothetical protein